MPVHLTGMNIVVWLQTASAICAFVAAWFWFRSATGKAPETSYQNIGRLPRWLNQAARYNRWAALFAGVSAVFAGMATLCGIL